MLRRAPAVSKNLICAAVPLSSVASSTQARSYYNVHWWRNAARRPQLTKEQRDKVVIDQSEWPAEFRDFDPMDPYKHIEDWHPEINAHQAFWNGVQFVFVCFFWECCFPRRCGDHVWFLRPFFRNPGDVQEEEAAKAAKAAKA